MQLRHSLCCALAIASTVGVSALQRPSVESDQQVLIKLEQGWNQAFYRKDLPFISSVLADEFVATYDDGTRADKAKEIALAATFNQQVDASLLDDFIVKVYGDTAVVWFTLHLVGPKDGKPLALTFRYIDVWVLRAGRWQCVASQSTKVA